MVKRKLKIEKKRNTGPKVITPIGSTGSKGEVDGNTRTSPSRHWCFTLNNYSKEDIEKFLGSNKIIFQEETGKNGTPHLQGYIDFTRKVRPKAIFTNNKIHWEKCRNIKASINYCRKGETRTGEVYANGFRLPPSDPIKEYNGWQRDLVDILKEPPDHRSIYWLFDNIGNVGKTSFAKHWCMKYPKKGLYLNGKASDMKYAIIKFLENEANSLEYVFMDFPRSIENYVSYQGIEEIKNGIFFNAKYESGMCIFNNPHVIVFANFLPEINKLSKDRWILEEITSAAKLQ